MLSFHVGFAGVCCSYWEQVVETERETKRDDISIRETIWNGNCRPKNVGNPPKTTATLYMFPRICGYIGWSCSYDMSSSAPCWARLPCTLYTQFFLDQGIFLVSKHLWGTGSLLFQCTCQNRDCCVFIGLQSLKMVSRMLQIDYKHLFSHVFTT